MKYEVCMDMRNENALCTISMLSALLETQGGDYLNLLNPFVLYSLPRNTGQEISVDEVTKSMREFGFVDFPYKLTETLLNRLCRQSTDGHTYVKADISHSKKTYYVVDSYDRSGFDSNKKDMRKKINSIIVAIQKYFENNFYYKTIPENNIREKLIRFFEVNGFTVIQSVDDLRLISKEPGSDSFEIARFILEEYGKQSLVYEDLCDVTKGFLTYKGLYYFLSQQKSHMDSKFQDVTFYLDCSLVLDALNYDTTSDYNAISELIRLVRRCGGRVAVFRHTVEEAGRLIDAFANKPQCQNNFRLDNLAEQNLSKDLLLAISKDIPQKLKETAKLDIIDTPSFSDTSIYKTLLGEEEIVNWLTTNRPSNGNGVDAEERYRFDAKSLLAVGMCRRYSSPRYIEQAKAVIVTQDPWLNRCLRELYREKFKSEVYYAITDADLVSLLWLQDHKQITNLPGDILIANAHAACRVSPDVMNRAIELANEMAANGTIPSDAALLVSSRTDFKNFIADHVRNDATMLNGDTMQSAVDAYITLKANEKIVAAREEERKIAQSELSEQKRVHFAENEGMQAHLRERDMEIDRLTKELAKQKQQTEQNEKERRLRDYRSADRKAKCVANIVYWICYGIGFVIAIILIVIFGIHCYQAYISEAAWIPYAAVEVVAFISVPLLLISRKSFLHKKLCQLRDFIYAKVYSWIISA